MKWISVKERLPEECFTQKKWYSSCDFDHECAAEHDYVLVYYKDEYHGGLYSIAEYSKGCGWRDAHCNLGYEQKNDITWDFDLNLITHWMPLPEPPKDKRG